MWPDMHNPSKVQVRHLPRHRKETMDLLLRKSEYQAGRQALIENRGNKARDVPQQLTKGEKKKKRKLRLQQEADAKQQKAEEEQQKADAAAVRYTSHPTISLDPIIILTRFPEKLKPTSTFVAPTKTNPSPPSPPSSTRMARATPTPSPMAHHTSSHSSTRATTSKPESSTSTHPICKTLPFNSLSPKPMTTSPSFPWT